MRKQFVLRNMFAYPFSLKGHLMMLRLNLRGGCGLGAPSLSEGWRHHLGTEHALGRSIQSNTAAFSSEGQDPFQCPSDDHQHVANEVSQAKVIII